MITTEPAGALRRAARRGVIVRKVTMPDGSVRPTSPAPDAATGEPSA